MNLDRKRRKKKRKKMHKVLGTHLNEFQWADKDKVGQKVKKQKGRKVKRRKDDEKDSEAIQTTANELRWTTNIERGVSGRSLDLLKSMIYWSKWSFDLRWVF